MGIKEINVPMRMIFLYVVDFAMKVHFYFFLLHITLPGPHVNLIHYQTLTIEPIVALHLVKEFPPFIWYDFLLYTVKSRNQDGTVSSCDLNASITNTFQEGRALYSFLLLGDELRRL